MARSLGASLGIAEISSAAWRRSRRASASAVVTARPSPPSGQVAANNGAGSTGHRSRRHRPSPCRAAAREAPGARAIRRQGPASDRGSSPSPAPPVFDGPGSRHAARRGERLLEDAVGHRHTRRRLVPPWRRDGDATPRLRLHGPRLGLTRGAKKSGTWRRVAQVARALGRAVIAIPGSHDACGVGGGRPLFGHPCGRRLADYSADGSGRATASGRRHRDRAPNVRPERFRRRSGRSGPGRARHAGPTGGATAGGGGRSGPCHCRSTSRSLQ
jgi:hypothetical protein